MLHLYLCIFSLRLVERKKAAVKRCEEQLLKMEVQATDREENKQIALGTSKLNYLDPRISVAWWVNSNKLDTVMNAFLHNCSNSHTWAYMSACKPVNLLHLRPTTDIQSQPANIGVN